MGRIPQASVSIIDARPPSTQTISSNRVCEYYSPWPGDSHPFPPCVRSRPAARLESFSRAAEELHLTHGAVSRQVRALEEHVGAPLFARHGKRVSLTSAGRAFAERIRAALQEIAQARRPRAAVRRGQRLTVERAAVVRFALALAPAHPLHRCESPDRDQRAHDQRARQFRDRRSGHRAALRPRSMAGPRMREIPRGRVLSGGEPEDESRQAAARARATC